MGCQSSRYPIDKTRTKKYTDTNVGLLDVNVMNGKLYQRIQSQPTNQPSKDLQVFLKIQVSNQQYTSQICSSFNCEGMFNSYFSFFINSNYRADGRILEIQLYKKYETSGSALIGKGSIDVTSLITMKQLKTEFKCIISKNQPLGYINCLVSYTPLEYKTVSFRFENFILRRRGESNYDLRIEVLLGEESLSTSICKDVASKAASWTNDILKFKVPDLLKFGKIILFDKDKYLGETIIRIHQFMSLKQNQELVFYSQLQDKQNNDIGNIKFSTIVGESPHFLDSLDKSVVHTNLQINVSRAQKSQHRTMHSSNSSGVEILIKNRDNGEKFVEDFDKELVQNYKQYASNNFLNKSLGNFSVFSIQQLSKIDNQQQK